MSQISKSKKIIFTILTWIVVLTGFNFVCGLVAKNTYISVEPVQKDEKDLTPGYFMPNQDREIVFPGLDPYKVRIDSQGFRWVGVDTKEQLASQPDAQRILTIGDSVTFGLFVDDEDSYPFKLQTLLNEGKKQSIVLNAGIGSASIQDYIHYMKIKGLALKPDWVILNFCNNDLGEMRDRQEPLYDKLVNGQKFSLETQIKLMKFMRIGRKFEMRNRYNRRLRKTKDERARLILQNESKDIEDILYIDQREAGAINSDPDDDELKPLWVDYFARLSQLNQTLQDQGIKFLYVIHPTISSVWASPDKKVYQDVLIKFLKAENINYIDLRDHFKPRKKDYLTLYNNLPRDFHLGGLGNQVLAQEIFSHLF